MSTTSKNYGKIDDPDALATLVGKLLEIPGPIGFDVETGYHGPDREKGSLLPQHGAFVAGFSFTNDERWARYVPVRHDLGPNMDPDTAFEIMQPLLEQRDEQGNGRVVAHHLKFEQRFMRREGIEIASASDSMLEAFCLSEWQGNGLKALVEWVFGHKQAEIDTLFPGMTEKQKKALRFNVLALTPDVVAYACEDAAWALALHQRNHPRVMAERKIPFEIDLALSPIVADMEDWGVAVDWEGLRRAMAEAEPFVAKYEAELKRVLGEWAGRDLRKLNLNSAVQLRDLLYDDLGLPITKMTKPSKKHPDGQPSTDAVALERLAKEHKPIKQLLELREINNLAKRFAKWNGFSDAEDGRVHPAYSMVTVGTARFASNDPPIQQCPKKWEWESPETGTVFKGNFREFITVDADCYYLGFDYSQIELRVMAGLSGEPALLRAFENDEDVHTLTAARMLGKDPANIDHGTERPVGKTMNFALLYGMGIKSLSDRLALSKERATELYDGYFRGFPSIRAWMDRMKAEGRARGSTITWIGRKYTVWELTDSNPYIQSKGERVLVNAPVQGGAADYMRLAMVRAARALKAKGWWGHYDSETGRGGVRLMMNQHDALGFEVHNSLHPVEVREVIQSAVVFEVKGFPQIRSDWEIGVTWGGARDFLVDDDGSVWTTDADENKVPATLVHGESPRGGMAWWIEEAEQAHKSPEPTEGPAEPAVVEPADAETPAEPEPADGNLAPLAEVRTLDEARARRAPAEGIGLEVRLREYPSPDQFARFVAKLKDNPGPNSLVLVLPDGERVEELPGTCWDRKDASTIALLIPGAEVVLDAASVQEVDVAAGLTL